jgi:hypothetical protein
MNRFIQIRQANGLREIKPLVDLMTANVPAMSPEQIDEFCNMLVELDAHAISLLLLVTQQSKVPDLNRLKNETRMEDSYFAQMMSQLCVTYLKVNPTYNPNAGDMQSKFEEQMNAWHKNLNQHSAYIAKYLQLKIAPDAHIKWSRLIGLVERTGPRL